MNLFFILLLLALIAAGYYVYQRLLKVEREIRADQRALVDEEESPVIKPDPEAPAPESAPVDDDTDAPLEGVGLKDRIMLAVADSPGLTQVELYAKLPDVERRELQKLLRELDQAGTLRREKKGSSYRLYPR